jgi:ribosomal protein S18
VTKDEKAGSFSPTLRHRGGTGLKNVYVPSIQRVKKKDTNVCTIPKRGLCPYVADIYLHITHKFVTERGKCLPRDNCCTAYCHA